MPEEIVARLLRLPGYGVYAWEADEGTNMLTLAVRPTAETPVYLCGNCGVACPDVHSWTERRIRDLPWGRGRCGCTWKCIGCAVANVGRGRSGCPS